MSKTTAPLLSFDARGQIGKTVVYGNWRGVKYARQHVIPANPRTTAQTRNRNIFAMLREAYKLLPSLARAPWDAYATGRKFTGMNAFVGENRLAIATGTDFTTLLGSPGARGGLPADGIAAVGGSLSGEIDVTFTAPDTPNDWTLDTYVVLACKDQAPDERFNQSWVNDSVAAPTVGITLSGLEAGQSYVVAGWTVWTKPDGTTAYGPSLVTTATATA